MLMLFGVMFVAQCLPDFDPKDTSKEDRVEFFSALPAKCRAYADFRTDSLFLEIDTLKYELKNANIKLDSIITLLNKQ